MKILWIALLVNCCLVTSEEIYDYIVVGSGAGGVVAARLAEAQNKVLLIEAGPDDLTYSCEMSESCFSLPYGDFLSGTPLLPLFQQAGQLRWTADDLEWNATSMPFVWNYNKTELNRTRGLGRAKMLGGCLAHNGQTYVRGSTRDFDFVAQNLNLPTWSFENVAKYYQRLEHYIGDNKTLRGDNGPINIIDRKPYEWEHGLNAFLDAAIHSGISFNNHQNGGYPQTGIGFSETNNKRYKDNEFGLFNTTYYRASSSQSYVRDIGIPSQYLTVWYNTTVQRVLFDNVNTAISAIGVEYYDQYSSVLNSVYCSKEVIISAGVYQSPKLLMLSGIGPVSELNKFNITPIYINNNIGRYGQDKPWFTIRYKYNTSKLNTTISRPTDGGIKTILNTTQYFDDKFLGQLIVFQSTNTYDRLGIDYNDIRLQVYNSGDLDDAIIAVGIETQTYSKNLTIQLNSIDARDWPDVYLNIFSDSRDYDVVIEGLYIARNIFQMNPTVFIEELTPGMNYNRSNINELRRYLHENIWTGSHAVGTLSMGGDNMYLYNSPYPINSKCAVRGVNNLRVVDSSIWPYATNAGDMSLVFMLGEKCAQHIIDDNKQSQVEDDNWVIIIMVVISIFIGIIMLMFIAYKCKKKNKQTNANKQDELSLLNFENK
eukprot:386614_1